jgi:subtilisin family serine protease
MPDKGLKSTMAKGRVIIKLKEQAARSSTVSISTSRDSTAMALGVASVDSVLKNYAVTNIVKLRSPSAERSSVNRSASTSIETGPTYEDFGFTRTFLVNVDPKTDVKAMVADLKKNPSVEDARVDYYARISAVPNDTFYNSQWGLKMIKCEQAWEMTKGDPEMVVAIVDTGVDREHPDLKAKLISGYDMVNLGDVPPDEGCVWEGDFLTRDEDPSDENGHGTHCAGIAAGIPDNARGIAGVAWNCKIMPVRVLANVRCTEDGEEHVSASGVFSDIADGIIWAADHGAGVISLSLGGYVEKSEPEPEPMKSAIDYAASKGCVVAVAMANDGADLDKESVYAYPARHAEVLAVGAVDRKGKRADFSNYGNYKQVMAPGVDIFSTYPVSDYEYLQGTSMATPFVSGLAALVKSANPHLIPQEVIEIIRQTSTTASRYNSDFGFGIVDGEGAIKKALGNAAGGDEPIIVPPFVQEVTGKIKSEGEEKIYKLTVSNKLVVELDGPDGADYDLYLRKGSTPTQKDYDKVGYSSKADESVALPISGPGDYYIMIHSYQGTGEFKLKARLG